MDQGNYTTLAILILHLFQLYFVYAQTNTRTHVYIFNKSRKVQLVSRLKNFASKRSSRLETLKAANQIIHLNFIDLLHIIAPITY